MSTESVFSGSGMYGNIFIALYYVLMYKFGKLSVSQMAYCLATVHGMGEEFGIS